MAKKTGRKFLVRHMRHGQVSYAIAHDEKPVIRTEERRFIQVVRELTGDELTMTIDELARFRED